MSFLSRIFREPETEPPQNPPRTLETVNAEIRQIEKAFTFAHEQLCRHVSTHRDQCFRVGQDLVGVPVGMMFADPLGRTLGKEKEMLRRTRDRLYAERADKMREQGLIR